MRNGATVNPSSRASNYASNGYRGTMYYTKSSNMKASENRLLSSHNGRHNVHKKSNHSATSGYVYTIVGQKRT